jgi:hypothetical protein
VLRLLAVALVAGGGACHQKQPSGTSAAGAAPSFCATLAAENELVLKALPAAEPAVPALRSAALCVATPRGGWGLSISGLTAEGGELWGRWSIVHGDVAARRLAFAPDTTVSFGGGGAERPAPRQNLLWSAARRIVPLAPTFHDFDGDGEPEAIVLVETVETNESGRSFTVRRGRVWSAAGDQIGLLAGARDFAVEEVRDVDGDGRPDLITHGPYAALTTLKCGGEEPYPVSGPPLLAHALVGGTFAWSDAVALDFAGRGCSVMPPSVMVERQGIDFAASARNVACARLRGATGASLVAEITAKCRPVEGAACPACDDQALLESWSRLPAPLRFAR